MHNINAKWAHEEWDDIDMHGNNMGMSWQDVCNEEYGFQFEQSVDQYGPRDAEKFDPDNEEYYEFNRNYNRNRAKFESADGNTDGFLNRDEWLLYNNPFKVQEVKEKMVEKIMAKIDTDQDGAISLQEYLNDWRIRVRIKRQFYRNFTTRIRKTPLDFPRPGVIFSYATSFKL